MKRTKKFLSLILSVILLMSLAMPVMAAQNDGAHNHTIIINETVAGHKYEAYQIFSGEVADVDGNMVLSNPVWGSGIDASKKVDWVIEDNSTVSLTLMEALKTQGVNPDYSLYLEANDVAGIVTALSKNNSTAHAENFAVIVGKYLTNNSEKYKTSKAYTHKKVGDNLVYDENGKPVYEETPENGTITNYQIRGLADGYYLVKENAEVNIPSATHTDYILEIVQDVTVTPKDGEVTVDKAIIEGTKPVDACANNIGDEIEFVITGTLPNNYDEFDTYYHTFVDTMSEGLTLDPTSIKVHTLNGNSAKEVDSSYYDVYVPGSLIPEGNTYLLPLENYDTKGSTANLVVEFSDLTLLSESNDYTVHSSTKIVVSYKAKLNEKAVIGGTGNPNKVYVTYDRSPYDDGYGKTPEDEVYVFTFKLLVEKYDGKNTQATDDDEFLDGAKFILAREREGHKQYAVLVNGTIGKWTSWTSADDLREYVEETYKDSLADIRNQKYDELYNKYGVAFVFESKNGNFEIIGLDLDTYWLIETEAPAGFNLAEPIKFKIDASYDKTLNRAPKEGETEAKDSLTITIGTDIREGNTGTGTVETEVFNNPGSQLPSTGGVGTTVFYILGGCLVAVAVVLLVTKKRMSNH